MASYRFIRDERRGPVLHLTFNRPEVRNAFNDIVLREILDWCERTAADREVRVVVLAGAGKIFCAGADLTWMSRMVGYSREENAADAGEMARMFAALNALPKPIVGRVHGAALGGGCGLVAICDAVVASAETVFGFTETKLGILPAVIAPYALAKIGESHARALFLSGERFDAERALRIGLVHHVVSAEALDERVDACVAEFLSAGLEAIAAAKHMIRHVRDHTLADAISHTIDTIAERRVSPEGQEGMRAFLEKRRPAWSVPPPTPET